MSVFNHSAACWELGWVPCLCALLKGVRAHCTGFGISFLGFLAAAAAHLLACWHPLACLSDACCRAAYFLCCLMPWIPYSLAPVKHICHVAGVTIGVLCASDPVWLMCQAAKPYSSAAVFKGCAGFGVCSMVVRSVCCAGPGLHFGHCTLS